MCGICGIIHEDRNRPVDHRVLTNMTRTMIHRGPNDEGYFIGKGSGLGMRRLSVIDLEGGHQPFSSENGQVIAVCNGELYNYKELRAELQSKGHIFRSESDVEILPHLFEEHGFDFVLSLDGMFGIALWDESSRTLVLLRDRMGEKPLYWTHQNGKFIFGSELKAILVHPEIETRINRDSLSKYLAYEYVPAPHTIVEGINKLMPGHILVFNDTSVRVRPYWDMPVGSESGGISEIEAKERVLELFDNAVKARLVSDVPLGIFLSGGLDSSAVAAATTRFVDPKKIKTFSISFTEKSFDESHFATRVAKHLGTDHHDRIFTPDALLKFVPKVADFLDEPFGDASIIPTYALSKFASESVTVALGGDGGDELFAGYPTFQAEKLVNLFRRIPSILRNSVIEPIIRALPASDKNISFDFKLKQFIKGVVAEESVRHLLWLGSFSPAEQKVLLAFETPANIFSDANVHFNAAKADSLGNRLLYFYCRFYLAEDILTKVDRASMGASLETRAPFLDHKLVEFVARLPYELKLKGFTTKYLLKKTMADRLPKEVISRSKKGFGIPVAKWLRVSLKEMAMDLLGEEKIAREGFFRPASVARLLSDHMKGRCDNRKKLWTLLMFEQWLERWG